MDAFIKITVIDATVGPEGPVLINARYIKRMWEDRGGGSGTFLMMDGNDGYVHVKEPLLDVEGLLMRTSKRVVE